MGGNIGTIHRVKSKDAPVMIACESSHKLALSLASHGYSVVYRCFDMWSVCIQRDELEAMLKRRHWFSYWICRWWKVCPLAILHRDGGAIHFVVGWNVVGNVALEVRA
jgi:hypothetical protein